MGHSDQTGIAGHVDAVIIARTQIQRGKAPAHELRGLLRVASEQCIDGVVMTLGLKQSIVFNRATLADRTVDRADPVRLSKRPGPFAQGACEEVIEARITGGIRIGRFGHIDTVALHEPSDQGVRQLPGARRRDQAGKNRQEMLRQQILQPHR